MDRFRNHRDTYLKFHSLSNHQRVKYYEEHIKFDLHLSVEEEIEFEIEYIFALFEIGKYEKVLSKIDYVIEKVIFENIEFHNNQDAFLSLLFKKAACLFNLQEYDQCITITKQLLNINPQIAIYTHLHFLALKQKKFQEINNQNYWGVFVILCGMLFYVIDIFLIDPFYNNLHTIFIYIVNGLFMISIGLILFQFIFYLFKKYV